jgi:uncharacterized protein YijF (DUF1287 family)
MLARRDALVLIGAGVAFPASAQRASRAGQLIAAARRQIGVTLHYDSGYSKLAFPSGDVARLKGVCTDVVIRAYRDAFGLDLQALVHADMKRAFGAYPRRWRLKSPDSNIDHRRVPNLQMFFARSGAQLPLPSGADGWRPGDIFTSLVGGTLPHIGFVSDRTSVLGMPLVIHNIGGGAREENALLDHRLTGRYRFRLDG